MISINCMALNGIDALWSRLCEEMWSTTTPKRSSKAKGKQAVEKALSTLNDKWYATSLLFTFLDT